MSAEAPHSKSNDTSSAPVASPSPGLAPAAASVCSGVLVPWSVALLSHPACSSARATSTCLRRVAACRAVPPAESRAQTSAPARSSVWTTSKAPWMGAEADRSFGQGARSGCKVAGRALICMLQYPCSADDPLAMKYSYRIWRRTHVVLIHMFMTALVCVSYVRTRTWSDLP